MEKTHNVTKLVYDGELDEAGRPHGKGVLHYVMERTPQKEYMFDGQDDLRYKGDFVHGLRQGEGDLHGLGLAYNPVSEYEWYSEGEYDSCGRLVHSDHAPGTWKRYVPVWYPYFEGTWLNDMPLKPRWGAGTPEERLSEDNWNAIRMTCFGAVEGLPFEIVEK